MTEKFVVTLVAIDKNDESKNESVTKTVAATTEVEAIEKAKELTRQENPEFNFLRIWAWHTEKRHYR